MQTVYWSSKTNRDVPGDLNWLSESEMQFLETLRFPKRRQDWLLGRWTAKYLLQMAHPDCRTEKAQDISILKAKNGAPYAILEQKNLGGILSLTHREQLAVAAWCPHSDIKIGVDLEEIEPKQDNFINDFFTTDEAAWVFGLTGRSKSLVSLTDLERKRSRAQSFANRSEFGYTSVSDQHA